MKDLEKGTTEMGEMNGGLAEEPPEYKIVVMSKEAEPGNKSDEKSRLLKDIRIRYASGFTMHALNHIQDGTRLERFIWIIKLLGLLGAAVWICWGIFVGYFSYAVSTTFNVRVKDAITYPTVYVCHKKNFHSNINRREDCGDRYSRSYDRGLCEGVFGQEYPPAFAEYLNKYVMHQCYPHDNDTTTLCASGSVHGQCVTINSDGAYQQTTEQDHMEYQQAGHYIAQHRDVFPMLVWISAGEWKYGQGVYRTQIDQVGRYVYKITKSIYKRLPAPYTDCVVDGSDRDLSLSMFSGPYTQEKCASTCRIRAELDFCGMIKNKYTVYTRNNTYRNQIRNITVQQQRDCWRRKYPKILSQESDCRKKCPTPCVEVKYHVHETYLAGDRDGAVYWEVRYEELIETEIGQEPDFDEVTLIANFGGTLGLMCGMSAVSILELLVWSLLSIAAFAKRVVCGCKQKGQI